MGLGLSTDDTWDEIDDPVLIGPTAFRSRPGARATRTPSGCRGSEYEVSKRLLQIELLKAQAWLQETGQKLVVLFEGRHAAGKGGTIKRFTEHLNPRWTSVVVLRSRRASASVGLVGLPALRAAPADQRRDRVVRPLLV